MERNAILATVLVIMILVGYQWYLSRFEAPPEEPARPAPTASAPPATPPSIAPPSTPRPKTSPKPKGYAPTTDREAPAREVVVETPLIRATLSTVGARITSWQLKKYHAGNGAPVELVAVKDRGAAVGPLSVWMDGDQFQAPYRVDRQRIDLGGRDEAGSVTFTSVSPSGVEIRKKLTFHGDRYQTEVDLTIRNLSRDEIAVEPRLAWGPGLRNSPDKKNSTLQPPTLWLAGRREQVDFQQCVKRFLFFCSESKLDPSEKTFSGNVTWAALQDNYFAVALFQAGKDYKGFARVEGDQPIVGVMAPKELLAPGGETRASAAVFAGPKDLDRLKAAGHDLEQLVDLGFFDRIYLVSAALWLLKFFYGFTGNYGIAIILVTVLQKIAFHPLTIKSLKSMKAMQEVQPKVQAIQERFKNNPKKKQEETMALYKKHGVNPMGGCLPMLVQVPIFFALYTALSSSIEMWQAPFLWIRDLTQPDSFLGITVWGGYPLNFLALLMGVSMWVQQKMSPPAGDPRQAQMMLWIMPIVFTFMFWSFPSGLVLYWLVNNALQIGQQWLITRSSARPAPAEGQAT